MNTVPHNTNYEKTVLGAILLESEKLMDVISILNPECFYEPKNRAIYEVITEMFDANEQIDMLTVIPRIVGHPAFKGSNPMQYVTSITQSVGSASHISSHAMLIKELSLRRSLLTACQRISSKAGDMTEDVGDALIEFSKEADLINSNALHGKGVRHIGEIVSDSLKMTEKRMSSAKMNGTTSGLSGFDAKTGGFQGGQLVILAARPAMGKTAILLHMAKSAAKSGVPVCIFSLEMSDVSLSNRLLLSECDVEADRFRTGELTAIDLQKLEQAAGKLESLPIYVDDNPMVSMSYIRTRAKLMQKQGKCGLILVDYLQLADTALKQNNRNREQEIAQASRSAKITAKELNVPFILLSQLSRECEKRPDRVPQLSDLRESGAIEQDADIVSFIYRPKYYNIDTFDTLQYGEIDTDGVGVLIIAKQRDGATGNVLFSHNPSMTKISDYEQSGTGAIPSDPF